MRSRSLTNFELYLIEIDDIHRDSHYRPYGLTFPDPPNIVVELEESVNLVS